MEKAAEEVIPPYSPDAPLILQVAEGYRLLCREEWTAANRHFDNLIAWYPTLSVAYAGMASMRGVTGEYEECRRLSILSERTDSEESSLPNPYWSAVRYVQTDTDEDATIYECLYGSNLAIYGRQWEDCEMFTRFAIGQLPDNPYVAHYHAVGLMCIGQFDPALELMEWVCDELPTAKTWYNRSVCEARLGNRQASIRSMRESINIVPNYQSAHHWLSRSLVLSGRWPSAFRHLLADWRIGRWERRKARELKLLEREAEEYVARYAMGGF